MEIPPLFCIRWNSYESNLQTAFPKLLTSEHFVDVTLACEKQFIKCHKIVLSACSVYFETLLVNNPCQHPIIFMKDIEFWEIKALVEFMYKGEVNVSQNQLKDLLRSAESLQIRGLSGSKQFENIVENESEVKGKKIKSDTEDEEENLKKKKKKMEEDEKCVEIRSLKFDDLVAEAESDKVVKEEIIEEEYDFENVFMEGREEEEQNEAFNQDVFYAEHNDPGPSGMSVSGRRNDHSFEKPEFISVDQLPLHDISLCKPEDIRKPKPNIKTEPNCLKRKLSGRRSSYKQYTMASMWAALERIEEGLSVYRASLEYGVPRKTLRNWMKKYNIMSYFDLRKQEKEKHDNVVNIE